ncbi:hypothetical protein [Spiroplasma endosymbiont of Polydrusus pterygomalis]|uniref:hypothetical protein n=1 Tax=Spiroplasma endosymbiont of Polydrusus pterygomalis TaxID=3139327 RepID=UPI003CCB64DB
MLSFHIEVVAFFNLKFSVIWNCAWIAPQVNSYLGYSKLKELKIDYMFGSLFGIYDEPQPEVSSEIKLALLKNSRKGLNNEIKK